MAGPAGPVLAPIYIQVLFLAISQVVHGSWNVRSKLIIVNFVHGWLVAALPALMIILFYQEISVPT